MWFFKHNGINFKVLQCALHNTEKDCCDAAQLLWRKYETYPHTTHISLGLPYLQKSEVQVLAQSICDGQMGDIQLIRSIKIIHSQKQWLTQISHKLHPMHFEKYKQEFNFQALLGTPFRVGKYQDYLVITDRVLKNQLLGNAWKRLSNIRIVIGPNDWYLGHCQDTELTKYVDLVYELHSNGLDINKINQSYYFSPDGWWLERDAFKIKCSQVSRSKANA